MNDGDIKVIANKSQWKYLGQDKVNLIRSFMSSLHPLHQQAAQHFDEASKRKQSESFLSQPEHTIFVSRHRTLRNQYLHWVFFIEAV